MIGISCIALAIIAKTICRQRTYTRSFVRLFHRATEKARGGWGRTMFSIRSTKSISSRALQGPSRNITIQLLISFPSLLRSSPDASAIASRRTMRSRSHRRGQCRATATKGAVNRGWKIGRQGEVGRRRGVGSISRISDVAYYTGATPARLMTESRLRPARPAHSHIRVRLSRQIEIEAYYARGIDFAPVPCRAMNRAVVACG